MMFIGIYKHFYTVIILHFCCIECFVTTRTAYAVSVLKRCRVRLSVRPGTARVSSSRAAAGVAHRRLHMTRGPREFWFYSKAV